MPLIVRVKSAPIIGAELLLRSVSVIVSCNLSPEFKFILVSVENIKENSLL